MGPEIHKDTLENGIRVITVPMESVETVTSFLFVNTGSNHETKDLSGISHYLEHLFFKGSEKYTTPISISSALDGVGAAYNAFTSEEVTAFYVKLMKDKLEVALDVMSDFLKYPLFTDTEIEREKNVILEELNMYYDTPQRRIYDVFKQTVYGDQPMGRDVGGEPETVKQIHRDDVLRYFDRQYKGENMVLVFAGNISRDTAMTLARTYFDGIKPGKDEIEKEPVVLPQTGYPRIDVEEKETDQTHIMVGFPSYTLFDEKRHIMKVLLSVLGGGMSSRLFNEIREKRGLCYYIYSSAETGTDFGYSYIRGGINKDKVKEAIDTIVDILQDIKENSITEEELERSKNNLEGHTYLGLENTDDVASFWGAQETLTNKTISPQELIAKIRGVSLDDVKEVANEVFVKEGACMSVIANDTNKDQFKTSLLDI